MKIKLRKFEQTTENWSDFDKISRIVAESAHTTKTRENLWKKISQKDVDVKNLKNALKSITLVTKEIQQESHNLKIRNEIHERVLVDMINKSSNLAMYADELLTEYLDLSEDKLRRLYNDSENMEMTERLGTSNKVIKDFVDSVDSTKKDNLELSKFIHMHNIVLRLANIGIPALSAFEETNNNVNGIIYSMNILLGELIDLSKELKSEEQELKRRSKYAETRKKIVDTWKEMSNECRLV
ncbi:hypothetical protein GJ496_005556 [Pomphorhynchus laevis]|nr:hypothetical protein GJ496_005556 [Pomphorhynchus laevis]